MSELTGQAISHCVLPTVCDVGGILISCIRFRGIE